MKRIVCDIDDTISFTTNRDWKNATPNQKVIDKINALYDQGWEIYLVTARGSLSCKTREEARDKYAAQIEAWMKKHGVKYTKLSFEKYLASYYVDDKSITPEEFVKLDIRVLKDGWSGAHVELRDGRVYKTADNSLQAAKWYDIAQHFFNTPKIYSLIGKTICMEYIQSSGNALKLDDIISIITKMKGIPYVSEYKNNIEMYIKRINNHLSLMKQYCDNSDNKDIRIAYNAAAHLFNKHFLNNINIWKYTCSFCHGDFSLENIIVTEKGPVLFDPIYESDKDTYSSWILDLSKMLHSLRKHKMMTEYEYLMNYFCRKELVSREEILWFELTQWIRTFKYAPTEEDKLNILRNCIELMTNNVNEKK